MGSTLLHYPSTSFWWYVSWLSCWVVWFLRIHGWFFSLEPGGSLWFWNTLNGLWGVLTTNKWQSGLENDSFDQKDVGWRGDLRNLSGKQVVSTDHCGFHRGFDLTKVATRDSFFRNSGICYFNQPWNGDLVNMIFGIEIATFDRFPVGVPFQTNSCKSTCLLMRISRKWPSEIGGTLGSTWFTEMTYPCKVCVYWCI